MISPIGIFGLAALLARTTPSASAAAVRGSAIADGGAAAPDAPTPDGGRYLLTEERRLLPHEGVMRTLIIRVTDSEGNQPVTDARRESDTWFGTHANFYSQNINSLTDIYEQCSGGKLSFVPSTGPGVVDGVLELTLTSSMVGMKIFEAGGLVRDHFNSINREIGIEFEAYSIILPAVVANCGGLARQGGDHTYYTCGADRSLELVVHEFGHTLGFHHSGLPDEGDYDDNHCMMGCCAGAQQMCFNAAKSYFSGWYSEPGKDGHMDFGGADTAGEWWLGNLVGIDDYLNDLFDEDQYRMVLRTKGGLYAGFNRAKGVNAGVKAYKDEVVIVQQWGEGGKSKVRARLNAETTSYKFTADYYDFEVNFLLCDLVIQPTITGPMIEIEGTASQSSTVSDAEASRAIDGNLDQTWIGKSVTHTSGDDDDLDPWWQLELTDETSVEHVRIFNRNDCCGSRLNNAILELYDASGEVIFTRNLGQAENIKEVFLGGAYTIQMIRIKLYGYKVLSIAEVQIFAPLPSPRDRQPDYARVLTYISVGDEPRLTCETTAAPTASLEPSLSPTVTYSPTIFRAVPNDVVLLRDNTPCIFQVNPANHPDRYKCTLEPTASNSEPGGSNNTPVLIAGFNECVIEIQPMTWSWAGTMFIFESDASLEDVNACFGTGQLLREMRPITSSPKPTLPQLSDKPTVQPTESPSTAEPTLGPSTLSPTSNPTDTPTLEPTDKPTNTCHVVEVCSPIPNDVVLKRDSNPCVFQHNPSNHVDRYKCTLEPTVSNGEPGGSNNAPVAISGFEGCILVVKPMTWSWAGTMFIFESDDSIETINGCFAAGELLSWADTGSGYSLFG